MTRRDLRTDAGYDTGVSTSSSRPDRGRPEGTSRSTAVRARLGPGRGHPSDGIDVAVAVDLVMLHRGLTAEEAHDLLRAHAEASGRDLGHVASDVIDLGTSRLPR